MEFFYEVKKSFQNRTAIRNAIFHPITFSLTPRTKILEFSPLNVDFLAGNLLFVSWQKTHFDLVFDQATWKQEKKKEKETRQERFDEYESIRKTWSLVGITCNQR